MPTLVIRFMLFLSSYFPLALIFFVLYIVRYPVWAIVILALGLAGLAVLLLYFFSSVALLVFIGVLGIVYVNSNMIQVNPMLNLFGYHLYEITVEKSQVPHSFITHNRVALGSVIHIIDIGDGIFLEKRVRAK